MEPQKLPLIPLYVTPGLSKQKEVAILKKVGFNNNKGKHIFELKKLKLPRLLGLLAYRSITAYGIISYTMSKKSFHH